jgi:hypothetical protein
MGGKGRVVCEQVWSAKGVGWWVVGEKRESHKNAGGRANKKDDLTQSGTNTPTKAQKREAKQPKGKKGKPNQNARSIRAGRAPREKNAAAAPPLATQNQQRNETKTENQKSQQDDGGASRAEPHAPLNAASQAAALNGSNSNTESDG